MPKSLYIPSYRLHKAKQRGVVTLCGRDIYLPGPFGSPESKRAYERAVAEWLANGRRLPGPSASTDSISVAELVAAFWEHAKTYYRRPDGTASAEQNCFKYALRPLLRLYADTPAAEFGPLAFQAVREQMIADGWCRSHISRQSSRLKHVFKWGVSQELIPPAVHQSIATVPALKRGRTRAAESDPVRPVAEAHVNAIKGFVSRQVWALIQLQLLTGARAGELVTIRPLDLDTSGRIWLFVPREHKTAHHGHERAVYLGPKAQAVVKPFLNRQVEAFIFSPAEAERERREKLHLLRQTPIAHGNRPGTNCRRRPKRAPADHYTVASYRRAIARACDLAFTHPELSAIPKNRLTAEERQALRTWQREHRWHPHQLRHSAATNLRKEFGIEAARIILGHRSPAITELYAELDRSKAEDIIARVG